ncbi:MAG: hypothetical protein FJX31_07595, partial [Alphaproteobacteria bacterium]|nr:hypothetical protein [Alphaproteobacteria bacterium]
MRFAAFVTATVFACQPVMAQAQSAPCITPKQAASLAGYALPSMIAGTTKRCDANLPAQSFLKA